MEKHKIIILGPQCSGKTTLVKYLRAKDKSLPIMEEDEAFTRLNGGEYPQDIKYKEEVLRPRLEEEIRQTQNLIFVTSYCNLVLLKELKEKGFKVIQLILELAEFEKRNEARIKEQGYADARTWMSEIFKFHDDVREQGLVDMEIDANQPVEVIAETVLKD